LITCVLLGEPDCSTYGICKRSDNASVCVCNGGFTGDDCSEFICPGTPKCSGNGTLWTLTIPLPLGIWGSKFFPCPYFSPSFGFHSIT
jgi:hypothetical protein